MTKLRRLSAVVSFAALALLQTGIALASCFASDRPALEVAGQCCQSPGENIGPVDVDSNALAQVFSEHCVRSAAPPGPEGTARALHPERPAWMVDRSLVAYARSIPEPSLRWFLTGPHATGPHLIYYLQRLLL